MDQQLPVVAATEGFPHDGCGYLAEARGEFHENALTAAFLLLAEEHRIKEQADRKHRILSTESRKLDKKFKFDAMRKFGKQIQTDFSMSGRWNSSALSHAGLHVHFGNVLTYRTKENGEITIGVGLLNIPRIIFALDQRFKAEIKAAKRAPGLYKLNNWGFEYRSLPASLDPIIVANFVSEHRYTW